MTYGDSSDRDTVQVADAPKRIYGNVLIDGADGQCAYIYSGIEERCPNDAVAHAYLEHGSEFLLVEMCAEHAREDVPELPSTEQKELVTDGGRDEYGSAVQQTYPMKFADEFVQPILDGEKSVTVRLASEWLSVYDRDYLELRDQGGEVFGDARVKRALRMPLGDAREVVDLHSGHRGYDVGELVDAMQGYYPDEEITPATSVLVIGFEVVDRGV